MNRHQKRHTVPKNWPLKRKGTTFSIKAKSGTIPLLIALRDMLKLVKDRRECKKALVMGNVEINSTPIKEVAHGMNILDIITIVPLKKHYILKISKIGKYELEETKEYGKKPIKIINKTLLKGKKVQLNLIDGRNILTEQKCKTNDSVLFDFKTKKIAKILEIKKGAKVIVFAGKHSGKEGFIENLDESKKIARIKTDNGEIDALIKQIIITE